MRGAPLYPAQHRLQRCMLPCWHLALPLHPQQARRDQQPAALPAVPAVRNSVLAAAAPRPQPTHVPPGRKRGAAAECPLESTAGPQGWSAAAAPPREAAAGWRPAAAPPRRRAVRMLGVLRPLQGRLHYLLVLLLHPALLAQGWPLARHHPPPKRMSGNCSRCCSWRWPEGRLPPPSAGLQASLALPGAAVAAAAGTMAPLPPAASGTVAPLPPAAAAAAHPPAAPPVLRQPAPAALAAAPAPTMQPQTAAAPPARFAEGRNAAQTAVLHSGGSCQSAAQLLPPLPAARAAARRRSPVWLPLSGCAAAAAAAGGLP